MGLVHAIASVALATHVAVAVVTAAHVVLNKEHARSAMGWIGLVWWVPLFGVLLYGLFGINRVERKARALGRRAPSPDAPATTPDQDSLVPELSQFMGRISATPLSTGNEVGLLYDGDEAYPAMLRDIRAARRSVALATYMFGDDPWGQAFVDALGEAAARGVAVRVLIDGIGVSPIVSRIPRRLRARGVTTALFLFSWLPWKMAYINLRNHRKVLVVDGTIGYTGSLNLRAAHVRGASRWFSAGVHARVVGPACAQLLAVFAADWHFTVGEALTGAAWSLAEEAYPGDSRVRVLPSGPDGNREVASWTFLGALACARRSVRVMTPYFLPDEDLLRALATCALRGVEVDVVLQRDTNVVYLNWAACAVLHQIVAHGVRVWFVPGPFDHSKLLVVDGVWLHLGSANWDERSMRLNFELSIACHDERAAGTVAEYIDRARDRGERVTLERLQARSLATRLRDGTIRLFQPYL